jgi:hypothetical protein
MPLQVLVDVLEVARCGAYVITIKEIEISSIYLESITYSFDNNLS